MDQYYFIYVLRSVKDGKNYTGYTKNLKIRFEKHNNGEVESTKNRRPLVLIYFEGCLKSTGRHTSREISENLPW